MSEFIMRAAAAKKIGRPDSYRSGLSGSVCRTAAATVAEP